MTLGGWKVWLPLVWLLATCVSGRADQLLFSTLNCYWFFGEENCSYADKPISPEEYSLKAGHLIGLLPSDAPLFIGLQEIGNGEDVQALAHSARARWKRHYQPLFVQGRDTATKQDVGALLDTTRGWGVYGRPSRVSDLEKELSKHLVVRLTNAVATTDVCVVHLRRPIGAEGEAKQLEQNRGLLRWSMRHLAKNPSGNVIILGDFNEGKPPGDPRQSLAVLFKAVPPMKDVLEGFEGKPRTHADGKSYDRILVSKAIVDGSAGLKLEKVIIGSHGSGKGERRRLYTDHFPLTVILSSPKIFPILREKI